MEVSVHEAKTRLSKLIDLVQGGENVVILRHGKPVVELVAAGTQGKAKRQLGFARNETNTASDAWWQPMSDTEAEDFYGGR